MRTFLPSLLALALFLSGCGGGGSDGGSQPAAPVTVRLTATPTLDGFVYAGGTVETTSGITAGDTVYDMGMRGFLSFDLAAIPPGAEVHAAKLTITRYVSGGNPYATLGGLLVDQVEYGAALDAGAYGRSFPVNQGCAVFTGIAGPETVAVTDAVQNAIDGGDTRSQFRLRWYDEVSPNGVGDFLVYYSADTAPTSAEAPTLEVTFLP